jgi:energy-coupling factor transporter ATP-binding protein EcfA2
MINNTMRQDSVPAALIAGSLQAGEERPLQVYEDYSLAVAGMRAILEQRCGKPVEMYISDDCHDEFWNLLEEDIRSESGVEWVAQIYEHVESRAFAYMDNEYRMYPTVRNNLFFYPEWGVGLSRCPVFRMHGMGTEEFIFAVDDASLQRFLEDTRRRRREMKRGQVTVFKDGPDGTEKEFASITEITERSDVVMDAEITREIYGAIDRFFAGDRSFYEQFGIPYKRGILLYGKPGNGKTTLVKSIAGSVNAPVAYWLITEYTSSSTIEEVFRAAVAMAPMILVVEDIDSMPKSARSYFLNTLDGAVSREGIFLVGTTNYPENIDPALINRAGRFDRAYEVRLPNEEARRAYLTKKGLEKLVAETGTAEAARLTNSFTFAQLNELYVCAVMDWHETGEADIGRIVKRMNDELEKGRTRVWLKEENKSAVGFRAV